jgi:hypothetical protein
VVFARHALSIDETRKTFNPVVWDTIKNDQEQKMKQVWFSGVHTDVGGGYQEEELSNITLKWMIKEAVDKGMIIYEKSPAYQKLLASTIDVNGFMHNEQKGFPGNLMKSNQRNWNVETHGEPCIHESVLKRTKNTDNEDLPEYAPWILKMADPENPCIEK